MSALYSIAIQDRKLQMKMRNL